MQFRKKQIILLWYGENCIPPEKAERLLFFFMIENWNDSFGELLRDFENAPEINRENLKIILADNRNTDYGKKHGFQTIGSAEEYTARLPYTDYSQYRGRICTPGFFTAYPIRDVLGTSGTTGGQKQFPVTEKALERYSSYILEAPFLMNDMHGKWLHASVFRDLDTVTILSASYYLYLLKTGKYTYPRHVGQLELFFSNRIPDVFYVKIWLALANPDLEAFCSVFLYDISLLFRDMEKRWETVLSDMENRRISGNVPPEIGELLLQNLPSPARLCELREEFQKGFDTPILPRLWKKVRFISGIGGGLYQFQERALRHYVGDVATHYFAYASSECMIGIAVEMGTPHYALLPRTAYYEFLPYEGEGMIPLEEVKEGGVYELVITTFSGLYRYKTGDLVKIISFIGKTPVVEICGRRRYMLDIVGEKIDGYTATLAVDTWAKKEGLHLSDYAIGINTEGTPSGYYVFVEGKNVPHDPAYGKRFDEVLCALAPDYADVRGFNIIACPKVRLVDSGDIARATTEGKVAHSKPHLFLNEEQTKALYERSEQHGKR